MPNMHTALADCNAVSLYFKRSERDRFAATSETMLFVADNVPGPLHAAI